MTVIVYILVVLSVLRVVAILQVKMDVQGPVKVFAAVIVVAHAELIVVVFYKKYLSRRQYL